ncbi:hypothetical protein E4U54_008251 [Claviceps lovelessii]|nr:hypothetical protein E4U54_008251 [Claviceps lovelessii]
MSQLTVSDFEHTTEQLGYCIQALSCIHGDISRLFRTESFGLLASGMIAVDLVEDDDKFAPHIAALERMLRKSTHSVLVMKKLREEIAHGSELPRQDAQTLQRLQEIQEALVDAQEAFKTYKSSVRKLRKGLAYNPFFAFSEKLSEKRSDLSMLFSTMFERREDVREQKQRQDQTKDQDQE